MKKVLIKALACALPLTMLFSGCSKGTSTKTNADPSNTGKPSTWIADRHVVVRAFSGDLGKTLPEDQKNNAIAKKIKELTGIELEFQYTAGTSSLDVLTTSIAAGDLPDLIQYYLNDSSRPEFPVVLKAAREGMFTDVAPLLKNTKVYSNYFKDGYLPDDTKNNVMFRPEFNGSVYMVHMNIPRENGSNDQPYRGGMYIQKSIVDALKIDPKSIKTQDQLYDLLKKIKEGNFKDANGKPVYPMGPRYWGGTMSSAQFVTSNYFFGVSNGFNIQNGKVVHEAETDYVFKQIDFFKTMLKEGLINPEFFTMDSTRAAEVSLSNSSAIIADVHNFMDIFKNADYLPLGPLNNWNGDDYNYSKAKSGYAAWSIPKTTKNPEEIVKLLDFLATKEGKLLWQYGIEGDHYDMVNGKPVPKQKMFDLLKSDDKKARMNTGIWMSGQGTNWFEFLGNTDCDNVKDFGELNYGDSTNPTQYEYAMKLYNYNPPKIKYIDGFSALGYLPELKDVEPKLKPLVVEQGYNDIRVKAIFAKTDEETKKIIDSYRAQLKAAGIEKFEQYLEDLYKKNPKSINFY